VEFIFEVPNGKWMLTVAPVGGWRLPSDLFVEYAMAVFASLALGTIVFLLLRQPEALRCEVARRTGELEEANRRLEAEIRFRIRAEEDASRLNAELERRVAERTAQLEFTNRELESFSYSVSHDLRAPLRHIEGFCSVLSEDCAGQLDDHGRKYLERIATATRHMQQLVESLLQLARLTRGELSLQSVDLTAMAREIAAELRLSDPSRVATFNVADGMQVTGDESLLRIALRNLLGNAWKYTRKSQEAVIEFGVTETEGRRVFFVRDNGAGFDMKYAGRLFGVFQRLHGAEEFEGTGVGLATVQRIIHRHGGEIWAEGEEGKGAMFSFSL
jgi:light-regulated signal transduction histidine kinase (bacteriophytochrome)